MPIGGKQWSAVLVRTWQGPGAESVYTLYYNEYTTTPAEIAGYYPTLSWDATGSFQGMLAIRARWLPHNDPFGFAYDTDEAAMLDTGVFRNFTYSGLASHLLVKYQGGLWRTDGIYDGSPSTLWNIEYPLNPLLADTTATPFGAYGNGLIRYQLLTTSDDVHTEPTSTPPEGTDYHIGELDIVYIFTPYDVGEAGGGDGEGDGLGNDDSPIIRVWGFSLDGHDFYVLRLGTGETLVYDLTTGTWSNWKSPGRDNWRVHVGMNWPGMSSEQVTPIGTATSDVVCGDDNSNTIFTLDPTSGRDDRYDAGSDFFMRQVVAGIRTAGRETINCGAVTADLTVGDTTQADAYFILEISDDLGESWTNCGYVQVPSAVYNTVVEWRGLGQIKHPGRLFRITDNGASYSIGALDLR